MKLEDEIKEIALRGLLVWLAVVALMLLFVGCEHVTSSGASGNVPAAIEARSSEAAAAVQAAREVNRAQPASRQTDVVEKELEVAQSNLPFPSQEQMSAASSRAQAALTAERDEFSRLYAESLDRAAKLQRDLDMAREQAAAHADNERGRKDALMMQTRITTYAAIGFMLLGMIGGALTQNLRIGAASVVLGGILLASSRIIATVPDWAYTVLFVTAGLLILAAPGLMWWAYRAGLFQKPPERVGEYRISDHGRSWV